MNPAAVRGVSSVMINLKPGVRPISKSFESDRQAFSVHQETAVLVAVALPDRPFSSDDPCEEIRGLAEAAGAKVVAEMTQKRHDIQLGTYIGSGKVKELKELVESTNADVVIFDNDLGPAQGRNLEKALNVKVIDRSELILDIFATRAQTLEARLQVELAQLEYSLPRLKNMWTHLSRQAGGGIGLRGPGETQLEVDRRLAGKRIRDLKAKLVEVQGRKEREVKSRSLESTVSLVGYTNAGKSQLMHALTKADVLVKNQLFSTLDTRTRVWPIPDFGKVLLSDTVGFIRDLPHGLVASFKATLEEARQAKLLLHVVDASNPHAEEHIASVQAVLQELGCEKKPTILVLNKVDLVKDFAALTILRSHHPRSVTISGLTGEGLDQLRDAVVEALSTDYVTAEVTVPAHEGRVVSFLHEHSEIFRQEYRGNLVVIRCYITKHLLHHIEGDQLQVRLLHQGRHSA